MNFFSFDDEYVRRLLARDPATEEHFFEYFRGRLVMKISKHLGRSEAEDLCQKVFARAIAALTSGKGPRDPRKLGAWMHGICENVLLERYRSRDQQTDQLDPVKHDVSNRDDDAELTMITLERIANVRKTIDLLEPRDALLLRAVFLAERDRDDVCRELGVTREYLRVLLHRALERFKDHFRDDDEKDR